MPTFEVKPRAPDCEPLHDGQKALIRAELCRAGRFELDASAGQNTFLVDGECREDVDVLVCRALNWIRRDVPGIQAWVLPRGGSQVDGQLIKPDPNVVGMVRFFNEGAELGEAEQIEYWSDLGRATGATSRRVYGMSDELIEWARSRRSVPSDGMELDDAWRRWKLEGASLVIFATSREGTLNFRAVRRSL